MHQKVFEEFDRVCRERGAGGDVLEIGAVPAEDSLLFLPALRGARSRVGLNLAAPVVFQGCRIIQADANEMRCFADASFDTVLSNAVHEHDRFFWKSLAEIRRVTRPGGLIAIGVPGFDKLKAERWFGRMNRVPLLRRLTGALAASTLCLQIHRFPSDYYRFSPEAVREVFLEGLLEVEVRTMLLPPRIIGAGVKGH